jgi:heterogeneous nuclear ribonucleoprotein U-like protein 1
MGHNSTFDEYGEKFAKNDIIGAFLDMEGDEISMTFTKNGEDQGDAFQIPKEKLEGRALFPHIMARNVKFEVNFGVNKAKEDKAEWKEKLEGEYVKVGKVAEEDRVSFIFFFYVYQVPDLISCPHLYRLIFLILFLNNVFERHK